MSENFPFSESVIHGSLTSQNQRMNASADNIALCVHITYMLYLGTLPRLCFYYEYAIEKNALQKIAKIAKFSNFNQSNSGRIDNQLKLM